MRFAFIARHPGIWPVAWLCSALDVSRSGFHAWLNRRPSARSRHDKILVARIDRSFKSSDRTYGARRVWHDVLADGFSCGLRRIERLMRENGLRACPRRRGLPKDTGRAGGCVGQPPRPRLRGIGSELEMGRRLHLYLDRGRLALRCRRRPVLAPGSRLGDAGGDDGTTGHRRPHHGDLKERQTRRPAASFGPGQPIYERAVSAADGRSRHHLFDEPVRQRLGQCGHGELLLVAQDRAHGTQSLQDQRCRQTGCVRLHRALLQSSAAHSTLGYLSPVEFEARAILA